MFFIRIILQFQRQTMPFGIPVADVSANPSFSFQLFYLLKGQLCALCNLPHSKFKDLRLRLRLIGTSFSLPLFLSMFFYSFFQLGRIQHIILNHQDVHILVVCMAFLRKAYSTAAKHRFNQSEYTLPAILSHFIDKRYIFSSNRQTA